ncbi:MULTISPECIES: hypothetical protein [unclassified Paenibacillus]|uniref:hypothetical protein n=1 Tax=unclassified Paenibacillus TaxID=185978 RepID=UPI0010430A3D|nr:MULTISPECIES: hypothetical protein [unclassified Paenibacillus]NIK68185.1 hypothetical protein [Paenibacillus sp. BK720]TCM99598.1 hypothetical protein EV294_102904 [Paenibacillus sp. BK033]
MSNWIDFSAQEVSVGAESLPLNLTAGTEILLTSVFLSIPDYQTRVNGYATIGWETPLLQNTQHINMIFRIRRGGFTSDHKLICWFVDSITLGHDVPILTIDKTLSLQFTDQPSIENVGTFQQYCLTAELAGAGQATISGPITLIGGTFNL